MKHVNEQIERFNEDSVAKFDPVLDMPVVMSEVIAAYKSLKNGKAAGHDLVTNEHLKYGVEALYRQLATLFNVMLRCSHVPAEIKKGIIITIIKDRHKSSSTPSNYRGITLLSVIYKLLESVILGHIKRFITFNSIQFPDPLQYAYQKHLSSLHASFIFQEVINYNVERGSKVYVCLLDTSKAFDVVWINGLFYKLFKFGICGRVWRLLRNAYTSMHSSILYQGAAADGLRYISLLGKEGSCLLGSTSCTLMICSKIFDMHLML